MQKVNLTPAARQPSSTGFAALLLRAAAAILRHGWHREAMLERPPAAGQKSAGSASGLEGRGDCGTAPRMASAYPRARATSHRAWKVAG